MHKDYHGLSVANTDPRFDEWFSEERSSEVDDYNVFDEVDDADKPEYD